jgi:predicted enzyme related to lactoylglutathione lyase
MALDFFGGIPVSDYPAALVWYEKLFGKPPTFAAHETESVWELGEHSYVAVDLRPERAGHAVNTIFVADLDERVAAISARGIEPAERERYDNGVRKITYVDPDGNEFGIGGGPDASNG